MSICVCSLAGTAACRTCTNNPNAETPPPVRTYTTFVTDSVIITGQKTNYDLIINKNPYKLAEWIAKILDHCENKMPYDLCSQSCPLYKCCNDQPSDNIEDWLKSPADKEEKA